MRDTWIPVPDNYAPLPTLIGPYECPYCAANVMLDGSLEDMFFTLCPHCGEEVEVPE